MNKNAILLILIIVIVLGFIIYLGNPQIKNTSLNNTINDTDIALAAWCRLDKFNLENNNFNKDNLNQIKQRIKDFILRYENKGPEKENLIIR
jgi:hypothetical protein